METRLASPPEPGTLPCPVCLAPSRPTHASGRVHLHRCDGCLHRFTDLNALRDRPDYDDDYYGGAHRRWNEHPNVALFERFAGRIERLAPGARTLLDVGCGRGDLLRHLRSRLGGVALHGVDLAPQDPGEGIRFFRGDFLETPSDRTFDAVTSLAVIEHVPDIRRFARRVHDLCAPGGVALLTTLDDRSVLYGAARALFACGVRGAFERLYDPHHVHHFSEGSLRRLLGQAGLEVIETLRHNVPLQSVDLPPGPLAVRAVQRAGVWGTFALGRLSGRTYLQTAVCRKAATVERA